VRKINGGSSVGIESVLDVDHHVVRLNWFGHLKRKKDNDWVKDCKDLEVEGDKEKAKGRVTWK